MHMDVVLRPTKLASTALSAGMLIPRSHRQFLQLLDGRKTLRDLSDAARDMGVDHSALATMVNRGLISWTPTS
ncbi:hypothetical protein AACH06_24575 [Ideonella sp. DXS29W]|uniref:MarR family transcriptional regulator n=1 Tax=Ideonella lacteola TaxID=2984193 RepID=A0ABU9BVL8_9BURK